MPTTIQTDTLERTDNPQEMTRPYWPVRGDATFLGGCWSRQGRTDLYYLPRSGAHGGAPMAVAVFSLFPERYQAETLDYEFRYLPGTMPAIEEAIKLIKARGLFPIYTVEVKHTSRHFYVVRDAAGKPVATASDNRDLGGKLCVAATEELREHYLIIKDTVERFIAAGEGQ